MSYRVYIYGSLAYDRIMDFPGRFADHIMPDKVHILNVSFVVNGMAELPGGTAGNIAYAVRLFGEKPVIMATIGQDYQRYFSWLASQGITNEGIKVIGDEFTACAHIITDLSDNQITGFNPGAMMRRCGYDLSVADPRRSMVVVAAGLPEDMAGYCRVGRERGMSVVFDPGQSLPIWEAKELARAIEGARVVISNDYELEMIMGRTGLTKRQLVQRTSALITTKGEQGSVVATVEGEAHIPAVKLEKPPLDPTGAGDAYRGGLVKALVTGKGVVEGARLGTVCASFAVEKAGTQTYRFTWEELEARYRKTFG